MDTRNRSLRELESTLDLAIRYAFGMAPAEASDLTVANLVFDAEALLIQLLTRHVMITHIVRKIRKLRDGAAPDNQLPIPGIKLPKVIKVPAPPTKTGKATKSGKVPLRDATLPQLLSYREELVRQNDKRVGDLDKLIAFMRKHAPNAKKITLGKLLEKHGQERFEFAGIR